MIKFPPPRLVALAGSLCVALAFILPSLPKASAESHSIDYLESDTPKKLKVNQLFIWHYVVLLERKTKKSHCFFCKPVLIGRKGDTQVVYSALRRQAIEDLGGEGSCEVNGGSIAWAIHGYDTYEEAMSNLENVINGKKRDRIYNNFHEIGVTVSRQGS